MGLQQQLKGVVFNNPNLPKLYADTIMNKGSKLLLDFGRIECWPSQANPAPGALINNMVMNAPGAQVVGNSITFNAGAMVFAGTNDHYLELGDHYNFSNGHSFLVIAWVYQPSDFSTNGFQCIIARAKDTQAANCQWALETGAGGNKWRGEVSNGATSYARTRSDNAVNPVGSYFQIALSYENGVLRYFQNGVQVNTTTMTGNPVDVQETTTRIGDAPSLPAFKGHIRRAYIEDLTESGVAATSQVVKDYAENSVRMAA